MDISSLKEYLKLLFKNGTAELMYFFIGLVMLSYVNSELFPFNILVILIQIGVIFSFCGIILRASLSMWRFVVLYIAETKEKLKNKEFTIDSSLQDMAMDASEKIVNKLIPDKEEDEQIEETYFEQAAPGEKFSREEIELDSLNQLNNGITKAQPELVQKIADLEKKIAELEK